MKSSTENIEMDRSIRELSSESSSVHEWFFSNIYSDRIDSKRNGIYIAQTKQ